MFRNMASYRIKLYSLNDEDTTLEYIGPMNTSKDNCFRDLRQ